MQRFQSRPFIVLTEKKAGRVTGAYNALFLTDRINPKRESLLFDLQPFAVQKERPRETQGRSFPLLRVFRRWNALPTGAGWRQTIAPRGGNRTTVRRTDIPKVLRRRFSPSGQAGAAITAMFTADHPVNTIRRGKRLMTIRICGLIDAAASAEKYAAKLCSQSERHTSPLYRFPYITMLQTAMEEASESVC